MYSIEFTIYHVLLGNCYVSLRLPVIIGAHRLVKPI